MENIILANKNGTSNSVSVISGGRDYRHKTEESKHGLHHVVSKKDGKNQAMNDLLDCQKKTLVQKRNPDI